MSYDPGPSADEHDHNRKGRRFEAKRTRQLEKEIRKRKKRLDSRKGRDVGPYPKIPTDGGTP